MSKNLKVTILTAAAAALLNAGVKADQAYDPDQKFIEGAAPVKLSDQEQANLRAVREWSSGGTRALLGATVNDKGTLVFPYGASAPTLVCSILQVCDVELKRGEQINSVNLGDSARWSIEAAVSGTGGDAVQHVLVKPLDAGLDTSMVITTDERTYRLKLKSTADEYMPSIAFSYPEDLRAQFERQQALVKKEREDHSITTGLSGESKTYLGNLNFKYEIEGDVSWKPVRVFDDGHKTVIEMPETMLARTAPSLLILEKEGGLFSDEKTALINYRLQGTRYIVDGLFETAILTMDVGDDQQRVVITREEEL